MTPPPPKRGKNIAFMVAPSQFWKEYGLKFFIPVRKIISHYELLSKEYDMENLSMKDILANFKQQNSK
jgi:hypothetical protein